MTHNHLAPWLHCLFIVAGLTFVFSASSCNEKDEDVPSDNYITSESVAITNFSLSADLRVMKNLDSVFFSIDLEHGVVFNADSLPKGTNVTKLVPKISYPSSVTSAIIEMTGGSHREGKVDYKANATDTIDFTGNVTLTLSTANEAVKKTYVLKVNVHKDDPDTVYWESTASMELPSRMSGPSAQKTVAHVTGVTSLIQENDGTYTLSQAQDVFVGQWKKEALSLGFDPVVESFTAGADGNFYMLGAGNLMQSSDGINWSPVASGWDQIIGSYGTALLGVSDGIMVSYPENPAKVKMPEDFPVSGYSAPIEFTNRWTDYPTIVLFGGVTASGHKSSASWAFDGSQWVNIADKALPPIDGLSVVNYYAYLNSATNGLLKEFEAYLAFGGRLENGTLNPTVFVTYDHGINWQYAQDYMQLPEGMEAGYLVDALSIANTMQSNLSDRWKARRKLPFQIDGDIIRWDCPHIFLFGGYDAGMKLNDRIRTGVLQRLTFVPLF